MYQRFSNDAAVCLIYTQELMLCHREFHHLIHVQDLRKLYVVISEPL